MVSFRGAVFAVLVLSLTVSQRWGALSADAKSPDVGEEPTLVVDLYDEYIAGFPVVISLVYSRTSDELPGIVPVVDLLSNPYAARGVSCEIRMDGQQIASIGAPPNMQEDAGQLTRFRRVDVGQQYTYVFDLFQISGSHNRTFAETFGRVKSGELNLELSCGMVGLHEVSNVVSEWCGLKLRQPTEDEARMLARVREAGVGYFWFPEVLRKGVSGTLPELEPVGKGLVEDLRRILVLTESSADDEREVLRYSKEWRTEGYSFGPLGRFASRLIWESANGEVSAVSGQVESGPEDWGRECANMVGNAEEARRHRLIDRLRLYREPSLWLVNRRSDPSN